MSRLFLVFSLLLSFVDARENPFKPMISLKKTGKATNIKEKRENLRSQEFDLPSSSRILKKVILKYQNVDGSISEKEFTVDKNIDWHYPLVISHNLPKPKPVVIEKKVFIDKKTSKKIEDKKPKFQIKTQPKENANKELKLNPFKFVSFHILDNEIKINTQDRAIRDFLLSKPYKVVIDFEGKTSFYTKTIEVTQDPFRDIIIGSHADYYRCVINLDGHYKYEMTETEDGYAIKLR